MYIFKTVKSLIKTTIGAMSKRFGSRSNVYQWIVMNTLKYGTPYNCGNFLSVNHNQFKIFCSFIVLYVNKNSTTLNYGKLFSVEDYRVIEKNVYLILHTNDIISLPQKKYHFFIITGLVLDTDELEITGLLDKLLQI